MNKTLEDKLSELPEEQQEKIKKRAAELIQEWEEYVESMGSIMGTVEQMADEMAQELKRLVKKCDKQATILKHVFPEQSNSLFICGQSETINNLGLPENILICPKYGSDVIISYKKDLKE